MYSFGLTVHPRVVKMFDKALKGDASIEKKLKRFKFDSVDDKDEMSTWVAIRHEINSYIPAPPAKK